jgi:hypothetical protein
MSRETADCVVITLLNVKLAMEPRPRCERYKKLSSVNLKFEVEHR